jgi:transketolase
MIDQNFHGEAGSFRDAPFADALLALARRREDVVVVTADLAKWTDTRPFAEAMPDRFVQVGMAEQNLIGVTGGLAKAGWHPIAVSFGVFATRRAYDQIAMSLATGPTRATVVGFLPGIMSRFRGTHQAIDDVALMRALPGITVVDPCDATELEQALWAAADHDGVVYLRANRGRVPVVFDRDHRRFRIGETVQVRAGADAAIVSTGLGTYWSLQAAAVLAARGIETAILHVPTLKPSDDEAIGAFCAGYPHVTTVENHSVVGGLGSVVAGAIASRGLAVRLRTLGVQDRWGEYGTPDHVRDALGLDAESIAAAVAAPERETVG